MPMNKDANISNCTMTTPTKKRSPANTAYSQTPQGSMTPNMNNMPGVNILWFFYKKRKS